MSKTEVNKKSHPQITANDSNAEYFYIVEEQEIWLIDYIIGIAFKNTYRL
jgi:hypothetical protein